MTTVPLEYGETARQWRWKQWLVLHPKKQPAILDLHAQCKVRLVSWKKQHPTVALIVEAGTRRLSRGAV